MNQQNPYLASGTYFESVTETSGISVQRPISVWFMQGVWSIALCLMVLIDVGTVFSLATRKDVTREMQIGGTFIIVVATLLAAGLITVITCLHRKHVWTKWLSMCALLFIMVYTMTFAPFPNSSGESTFILIVCMLYILMPIVFLWWIYTLGFTENARKYFHPDHSDQSSY